MKVYSFSGAYEPKRAVLALFGSLGCAAGLGFLQGSITGWLPEYNMLLDVGLAILVGGFLGKALTRCIRSAAIRNTVAANVMSFVSIATTLYFCWIAWFSERPNSWVWKPSEIAGRMEEVIALYPNSLIPVYWYWVYIASIVAVAAVSNNKWYHSGFCEQCLEWCEPLIALGPGLWPPGPIETEDDLLESTTKAPEGKKSLILQLARCPACKKFSTAELLRHDSFGGHKKHCGLYQIQLAVLEDHLMTNAEDQG